jgi:surface antigen
VRKKEIQMSVKRIASRVIYERHRWIGGQSSVAQTKEHAMKQNGHCRATAGTAKTVETRQTRAVVLRRILAGVVVSAVGIATLVVGAESAAAAGTFNTTGSVNVRSGPGTNYGVVAGEPSGASFSLICQWQNGTRVGGNATWDRVQFSNGVTGAISDYWTTTPSWNSYAPGTPDCTQTPPVPTGLPAGARNIGYNPFAAHYSNQCTYYAEERMHSQTARYMPVYGNAYQWAGQARTGGWTVGTTAAVNAVAVFPAGAFGSSVGHVAWVIGLGTGTLYIQDYNWNWVGAHVTTHWVSIPAGTQYIYSNR